MQDGTTGEGPGGWRSGRLLVGSAVVLALVAGAVVGIPAWQRHRDEQRQQQAYDEGHRALQAADCAAAVSAFDRAAASDAVPAVAERADAERELCRSYLKVVDPAPGPPARLLALLDYTSTAQAGAEPLLADARRRGAELVTGTDPEVLSTDFAVCGATDRLVETGLVPAGLAAQRIPALLLACVDRARSPEHEDPNAALDWLELLVARHPDSPQAKGAGELATRLWVQTGRYFHSAGTIDPWEADPSVREGSDRVRLELYNDGREPLTLRLSGPVAQQVTFPACRDCPDLAGDDTARCARKGPLRTVLLPPGTYELVTGEQRTLLRYGRMTFRAHGVYRRCFFSPN